MILGLEMERWRLNIQSNKNSDLRKFDQDPAVEDGGQRESQSSD